MVGVVGVGQVGVCIGRRDHDHTGFGNQRGRAAGFTGAGGSDNGNDGAVGGNARTGRLAAFLLQHGDAETTLNRQQWTQDEIAAHLGTVREMVGRAFKELQEAGLIRLDRHRFLYHGTFHP